MKTYEHLKYKWATITPQIAAEMLASNTANARHMNIHKVDDYARDMVAGQWGFCDQPIAFFVGGALANGQHRLLAIVKSGATIQSPVVYDVPPGTRFDLHLPRSMSVQTGLTTGKVSMIRAVLKRGDTARMTPSEIDEFYHKHQEAIEFVYSHCAHDRSLGLSPLKAVTLRAFYHADHARLLEFFTVMRTGIGAIEDSAAIRLRNWLMVNNVGGGGGPFRRSTYARTEHALAAFLKREPQRASKETDEEHFPLPEEQGDTRNA